MDREIKKIKTKFKGRLVYIIFVIIFTRFIDQCKAQQKITLEIALEILENQNPDMIQSNLNRILSLQAYKDAKNALLPQINLGISNNYNLGLAFDQIAGQLITDNKWSKTANVNIGLRVPLFQGFSRLNYIRMAELNLESEDLSSYIKKKALMLELLTNYFDALANMEMYNINKKQLDLSLSQLKEVKVELGLGTKTVIDVSILETQASNEELRVMSSKSNFESKILAIKELLNIPLNDSIILELPYSKSPFIASDTTNFSRRNPEIALSLLNVRKAELQLKMNKNLYYPTLSFSSGYGTNYSSERRDPLNEGYMSFFNQINQNKSLYLGFSLNFPILDGYRIKSEISNAKIKLAQSHVEQERTIIMQQKILMSAIQEYNRSLKESEIYELQLSSTKSSLNAMQERYNLGLATPMDLAKSILDYNLSELNLIRSQYTIRYYQEVLKILK